MIDLGMDILAFGYVYTKMQKQHKKRAKMQM